jgi:hypothetical protein
MLRKMVIASAVVTFALFPTISTAAGGGGGGHGGPGSGGGGPHVGGGPHGPGGPHFGGHEDHEHHEGGRVWQGRWWPYGVGDCWHLDGYGRYFWVCE